MGTFTQSSQIVQNILMTAHDLYPGDIVGGALGWWGLRAYAYTSIGINAVRLRRNSDQVEQDFVTITGGGLDLSAISSFKGAASLFVTKLYDQSGNGRDLVQATAANQPAFTLSAIGTLPALDNTANTSTINMASVAAITQAQPLSVSMVAKKTLNQRGIIFSSVSASLQVSPQISVANTMAIHNPNDFSTASTDNVLRASQFLFNGTSSEISEDGTTAVGDAGTGGISSQAFNLFGGTYSLVYGGLLGEIGIWGSLFSGANKTAMNANQHAFWGF